MNKFFALIPLALILPQCLGGPYKNAEEGDGYVFYKGLRRFLSDGTELDPLVQSVEIEGEPVALDFDEEEGNAVAFRQDQDIIDCYVKSENDGGVYSFFYRYSTDEVSDPRLVTGLSSLPGSVIPGARDHRAWNKNAEGKSVPGILRDGTYYASEGSEGTLYSSLRGEYELYEEGWTTYLAYRPFASLDGAPILGERVLVFETNYPRFIDPDLSSPNRYFYTGGENARWYRFDEETLELEDLGPCEKDRYRFLNLHYEGQYNASEFYGEPMSTRYFVEEGDKTYAKDLANPSYVFDVTEKIPQVEELYSAGYSEDLGFLYYGNGKKPYVGDGYLESEKRWVNADITNSMYETEKTKATWEFSYEYLKTSRYIFQVNVHNRYILMDARQRTTFQLLRAEAGTKKYYRTQAFRYSPATFFFSIEVPFLYDYVDAKGDEILEVGSTLSPLMNAPRGSRS